MNLRKRPNDSSSATRPTGGVDCNQSAMAGFLQRMVRPLSSVSSDCGLQINQFIMQRISRAGSLLDARAGVQSVSFTADPARCTRVGVDNAAGNDRKYGADVLDRVVRHGEVVVA